MYPPYCICCNSKSHWSSDWDASDYGYEHEGVIGLYTCSNCSIDFEIRDFNIDGEDVRSVKYNLPNIEDDEYNIDLDSIDLDINYCIYCKTALTLKSQHNHNDEYITIKRCDNCNTEYRVVDDSLIDLDDMNYDNYIDMCHDIYYDRTIFIDYDKTMIIE